jgi:hypothetical protein
MSSDPFNGNRADTAKAAATRHGVLLGLLTLILAAFLLSGCAALTGGDSAEDSGGDSAATTASELTATPPTVSFGNVNTGNSSSRNVTVANSGSQSVTVSNLSISGAGFNASGVPTGLVLTPGQTAALSVTFAPASPGSVAGKVTVSASNVSAPLEVALSGTGVTASSHTVTLNWDASTSSVAGYRAYRATTSGGPYTPLNSAANPQTSYTDSTVQSGTTYYYVVTAVDADTVESVYSNQASAAVPSP